MRSLHRNWRHREDVAEARDLVAQKARIGALSDYRGEVFRASAIYWGGRVRLPTLIRSVWDLILGNLKSGLGDAAGFSSVDFRIVFLPPLTNSMSSLSSRLSLICPRPNEACSIQSCAFQFLRVCFRGPACTISMNAPTL